MNNNIRILDLANFFKLVQSKVIYVSGIYSSGHEIIFLGYLHENVLFFYEFRTRTNDNNQFSLGYSGTYSGDKINKTCKIIIDELNSIGYNSILTEYSPIKSTNPSYYSDLLNIGEILNLLRTNSLKEKLNVITTN